MQNSGCVLAVDDDPNDIFLLRRGFQRAGLSTELQDLPDGILALEYLQGLPPYADRARYPFPSVLLLDLKMPKMNGFEVLTWLGGRPEMKALPVVVLSSSSLQADRENAGRLGAREFLVKPTEATGWAEIARGLHERWLASGVGAQSR